MTSAGGCATGGRRLDIDRLVKRFGATRAIDSVTLSVPPGALVTLLGPSGCGKTTLMRSIAGFVTPDAGDVRVDGRSIVGLAPERRSTAMLFQSYSLFPHMTVAGNVAFGLRMRRVARGERERRVGDALRRTRIDELAARFPGQLSGGQQQRVALARAIVTEPDILLLDEPFGALDQALREHMQVELRKLQQSLTTTTLVVTHDQHEALMLSDLIAVMHAGRIEQIGPPSAVYDRPATRFVASFMGFENLLPATLDGGAACAGPLSVPHANGSSGGQRSIATLAFRADAVVIDHADAADTIPARIGFGTHRGSTVLYELMLADDQVVLAAEQRRGDTVRAPGTRVGIRLVAGACTVLAA